MLSLKTFIVQKIPGWIFHFHYTHYIAYIHPFHLRDKNKFSNLNISCLCVVGWDFLEDYLSKDDYRASVLLNVLQEFIAKTQQILAIKIVFLQQNWFKLLSVSYSRTRLGKQGPFKHKIDKLPASKAPLSWWWWW